MKKIGYVLVLASFLTLVASCGSSKETIDISDISDVEREAFSQVQGDTINIANEKTEYQIIIIEPGFNIWLQGVAQPKGYYSQSFIENRNLIMVMEWNRRVLQPNQFDPNLYEQQIDYRHGIDYGYEANYKLYNYFIYFQRKYQQRLGPFLPRI